MSSRSSKHVAILGGGIIGLSAAYFLLKRGHHVTVLERGPVEHDSCAHGCAGMICPSHFVPLAAPGMVATGLKMMLKPDSPFHIKPRLSWSLMKWGWKFLRAATPNRVVAASEALRDLSMLSRKLYLDWDQQMGPEIGLRKRGLLMLCQTKEALREETHLVARAEVLGIPAQALTAAEVAALDPSIEMNTCGGVYFPEDCHLDPSALLGSLERQVHQLGGIIRYQSEVTGFELKGDRVTAVKTKGGRREADEFLLCGGAWSPGIMRELKVRIPIQAGKGYSLTLPNPPAVAEICSILVEARVAVTPMDGTMRFGGTLEIAGLDQRINPRRLKGIVRSATEYFPQYKSADFTESTPWTGLRPCSPDGLPYLGRFSNYENLSTATGHAMLGLSLAPATGWAMAELLSGETPDVISPLFDPNRFN